MKHLTHTKEWEEWLYEKNGAGKKIVGHSKLKLWTFFWGHGEHEWFFNSVMTAYHNKQCYQPVLYTISTTFR